MDIVVMGKKPKSPVPLEREILGAVFSVVQMFCPDAQRQNTGAFPNAQGRLVRCGKKGNPDITATIPWEGNPYRGKRLEIETKRPGGFPTPEQLGRIRQVLADGGVAFWVTDATQAHRVLDRLKNRPEFRVELADDGFCYLTDEPSPDWIRMGSSDKEDVSR